jgi:hypothetical protein
LADWIERAFEVASLPTHALGRPRAEESLAKDERTFETPETVTPLIDILKNVDVKRARVPPEVYEKYITPLENGS